VFFVKPVADICPGCMGVMDDCKIGHAPNAAVSLLASSREDWTMAGLRK